MTTIRSTEGVPPELNSGPRTGLAGAFDKMMGFKSPSEMEAEARANGENISSTICEIGPRDRGAEVCGPC